MMNCIWARNTDVETLDPVAGEVIQGREENVALSVGSVPPNILQNIFKSAWPALPNTE